MRYLDVTFDLPPSLRHPMEEFLRSTDAIEHEELLAWNTSGKEVEWALFYVEGEIDPYRDRIHDVETIRDVTLTPVDGESFYSYVCQETREEEEAWREAFVRRSLVVVPPLVYDETGVRLTVVGDSDDLSALLEDLPAGIDITVHEVGDYDRRHATVVAGVTDRQLEVVDAAVELGYYATPREATIEDVAEAVGCAPSTASTHLQKAEERVMRRITGTTTKPTGPSMVSD